MALCTISIVKGREEKRLTIRRGLGLQALEGKNPGLIEYDCRKADCGVCIIKVAANGSGLSAKTQAEADFLKAMRAETDERLACQCRVFGDCQIEIEEALPT